MTYRIGVDLDNTIACYDGVFCNAARALGMLNHHGLSKSDVKAALLSGTGGQLAWQKLQGQVYGKYMHLASVFPGFSEFLALAKLKGHSVVVVSHKSVYGHFDESGVKLRDAALEWMRTTGLLGSGPLTLSEDEVFFEGTRAEKIERIRALGCTHFIDDLQDVFDEVTFPSSVDQILFDPSHGPLPKRKPELTSSWREIAHRLLGEWADAEVCSVAQARFPTLGIQMAKGHPGRGNSRIVQLLDASGKSYALKIYPDRQLDGRRRLETEFAACRALAAAGFPVPDAVVKDEHLNWAAFQWVSGTAVQPSDAFVSEAARFLERLVKEAKSERFGGFADASESCLCGADIVRQIDERIVRLRQARSTAVSRFLDEHFVPTLDAFVQRARDRADTLFDAPLARSMQLPSPSDFGAHNAIRDESGQTTFIDFEYFGWDDPVKLVSDFYFHPGMNLSDVLRESWIQRTQHIFRDDVTFEARLMAYLPLFGMRWCLILLNEFIPHRLSQRNRASRASVDVESSLSTQLEKAQRLLARITAMDMPGVGHQCTT